MRERAGPQRVTSVELFSTSSSSSRSPSCRTSCCPGREPGRADRRPPHSWPRRHQQLTVEPGQRARLTPASSRYQLRHPPAPTITTSADGNAGPKSRASRTERRTQPSVPTPARGRPHAVPPARLTCPPDPAHLPARPGAAASSLRVDGEDLEGFSGAGEENPSRSSEKYHRGRATGSSNHPTT